MLREKEGSYAPCAAYYFSEQTRGPLAAATTPSKIPRATKKSRRDAPHVLHIHAARAPMCVGKYVQERARVCVRGSSRRCRRAFASDWLLAVWRARLISMEIAGVVGGREGCGCTLRYRILIMRRLGCLRARGVAVKRLGGNGWIGSFAFSFASLKEKFRIYILVIKFLLISISFSNNMCIMLVVHLIKQRHYVR